MSPLGATQSFTPTANPYQTAATYQPQATQGIGTPAQALGADPAAGQEMDMNQLNDFFAMLGAQDQSAMGASGLPAQDAAPSYPEISFPPTPGDSFNGGSSVPQGNPLGYVPPQGAPNLSAILRPQTEETSPVAATASVTAQNAAKVDLANSLYPQVGLNFSALA